MGTMWQKAVKKREEFLIRRLIHNGIYTWEGKQLHTQNLSNLEKAYRWMLNTKKDREKRANN